jgi:hypothetical protein
MFGFGKKGDGSAFARIAGQDEKINEAKGRLSALKDASAAKRSVIGDLHSLADAAHKELDAVDSEFEKLLARL